MRARVFVVIVVLILTALVSAQQRKANTPTSNSSATQHPTEPAPVILIDQSGPDLNQDDGDSDKANTQKLWTTFLEKAVDPVAWFTFCLLVVSFFQWRTMQHQSSHMEAGLALTRESNTTNLKAVQAAETSLRFTQRAYLLACNWKLDGLQPEAGLPTLSFTLVNVGATAGIVETTSAEFIVATEMPTDRVGLSLIDEAFEVIAGNQRIEKRCPCSRINAHASKNITSDEWEAVRTGAKCLWIYGLVRYRDVFNDPHRTRFCLRYIPAFNTVAREFRSEFIDAD